MQFCLYKSSSFVLRKEAISNASITRAAIDMASAYNKEVETRQLEVDKKNLEIAIKLSAGQISEAEAACQYRLPLKRARVSVKPANFTSWGSRFKKKSRVGGGGRGLKVNTPGNYLSHDDPLREPYISGEAGFHSC